ncbi:hypothetical protein ACHAQJ_005486 [Trichoderma viride]
MFTEEVNELEPRKELDHGKTVTEATIDELLGHREDESDFVTYFEGQQPSRRCIESFGSSSYYKSTRPHIRPTLWLREWKLSGMTPLLTMLFPTSVSSTLLTSFTTGLQQMQFYDT